MYFNKQQIGNMVAPTSHELRITNYGPLYPMKVFQG